MWAANGINRPDSKKRTASSARNAQDVDIYVFRKDGVYLYDHLGHALIPVVAGDQRSQIGMMPVGGGTPELKYEWGAIDTGIVSQNIALFCAATGLGTRPRASIAKDKLKSLLKLKDTQNPFLEHPVGYLK